MPIRTPSPPANAVCPVCALLEVDCNCHECEECRLRLPCEQFCHDCERCADTFGGSCCSCVRRRRAAFVTVVPRTPSRSQIFSGDPSRRYPRYLGVEIECGSTNVPQMEYEKLNAKLIEWGGNIHMDGSISSRLGQTWEAVTGPARGDAFVEQVKEICKILRKCNAKVDSSCGLHVHVGVPGWTIQQVLALVRLYAKVEPALYQIVPRSRATGTFSGPWGETFNRSGALDRAKSLREREEALDIATYGSVEEAGQAKASRYKHGSRYHGLNLNSIPVHGTIEFRLHSGTVNAHKILMWSAVVSALVEYASTHAEEEIEKLDGESMSILKLAITDTRLQAWIQGRYIHFQNKDRARRGLPLLTGPETDPAEASED